MKEYIERGELESILHSRYEKLAGFRPDFYAGYSMAFHIIENEVPTAADVVEVRHGQMIEGECTVCGWHGDCVDTPYYNYCPNCGARMDKEE